MPMIDKKSLAKMKSAMINKKRLDFEKLALEKVEKGAEINENKKVTLEKMRKSNSVENKKYTKNIDLQKIT